MRKIAGAILIFGAVVLYATERIERELICLEMAIRNFGIPLSAVNNWVLVGFAIFLFVLGMVFLFWRDRDERNASKGEVQCEEVE